MLKVTLSRKDLRFLSDITLGAVIPVAPGRMRNIWYPAKLARYMTQAQLEILGKEKIRRYFDFRLAKEDSDSRNTVSVPESGATPRTSVKLQKVRSHELSPHPS